MARQGTPLPFAERMKAKQLREADLSFRAIARELGISHHTAKKYAKQVCPKR